MVVDMQTGYCDNASEKDTEYVRYRRLEISRGRDASTNLFGICDERASTTSTQLI